jgi:RNA recognition motif-containing protein
MSQSHTPFVRKKGNYFLAINLKSF